MTSGEAAAIQVRLHLMMPVAIAVDLGALGPRRMVVVSSAACALAPSVGALIAARAVQGMAQHWC
jgi:MFS family permease